MTLKKALFHALTGLLPICAPAAIAQQAEPAAHPNILVVVVDDAAYMDFGAYGGEASTPNIDALAARGVKLSRYITSPQCAPSRAMLLTGADSHAVGVGTITEVVTDELRKHPGYQMRFAPETITLADRLHSAGYQTFATGKWGIGDPGSSLPPHFGFDHSYVLDASGADNWEQKPYMPLYLSADWYEDGLPVQLPKDYYSSELIIDKTIAYLDAADPAKPFFAYVGFQAIHIPIQAPLEYIDRYNGRFDAGWPALRAERFARAKALGLIPKDAALAALPKGARDWDRLDARTRALMARMMQVNAGMLEAMDFHLGRLLDHLTARGALQDTIVLVVSDNGPEYNMLEARGGMALWMALNHYSTEIETLGQKGSLAYIGPEWAAAASSPLSLFKFHSTEGGLRVPLVLAGPGVRARGFLPARAYVTDVVPTLLDLAGIPATVDPPGTPPIRGRSLRPALNGAAAQVYHDGDSVGLEVAGNAALYQGDWKILRLPKPLGDGAWHLYNLADDPGETRDLAGEQPLRFNRMLDAYARYAAETGVVDPGADYNPVAQIYVNSNRVQMRHHVVLLGLIGFFSVVAAGTGLRLWQLRRARRAASGAGLQKETGMHTAARIAVGLAGLFSLGMALTALAAPGKMATMMGFDLGSPLAASSIRGDFTAFFGLCALACGGALFAQKIRWLWVPVMLYGLTGIGRLVSVAISGGAAEILPLVVVELVIAGLIWFAVRTLRPAD